MNDADGSPPPSELPPVMARPIVPPLARPPVDAYGQPAAPTINPLELPTLTRRAAVLDLSLVALVLVVAPFGFQILASLSISEDVTFDLSVLALRKWFDAGLAAGVAAYLLRRNGLGGAAFGWQFAQPGRQLGWAAAGLAGIYGYMFATVLAILALLVTFPELQGDLMRRVGMLKEMPLHDIRKTLVLLIPVAIHEELVFRGLLLPYLRRLTGRWTTAVAISAVVFGLLHMTSQGVLGSLQIIGLGIILSVVFVVSRSLPAVILVHFAFDFLQFQVARALPSL